MSVCANCTAGKSYCLSVMGRLSAVGGKSMTIKLIDEKFYNFTGVGMESVITLPNLDNIKAHIHEKLCMRENLDPSSSPLKINKITRSGKMCGLFFEIKGPRMVRCYALWAGDEERILFYDSAGQRFAETKVHEGPDLRRIAA